MGQRSQIYVFTKNGLQVANYYGWNYGTRMISRARYGLEWCEAYIDYAWYFKRSDSSDFEKFRRIWDVNFDYQDIVMSSDLIKEAEDNTDITDNVEFADYVLNNCNNDGKLFVFIDTEKKKIKYALTDSDNNILTPTEYLNWNVPTWEEDEPQEIKFTENNIQYLNSVEMLTDVELTALFGLAEEYLKPKF